jgi:hypothetical protein
LRSAELAKVPVGTYGPYLSTSASGTIAVWAALEGKKRRFHALAIGPDLKPLAKPSSISDAPADLGLVALRPSAPSHAKGGFVLLFTHREQSGQGVEALVLSGGAERRGGPTSLAHVSGEVLWLEAIALPSATLAFWAARRDDRADLYAVLLGPTGEPTGGVQTIARDVRAWQAVRSEAGAALAVVRAAATRAGGRVEVVFVGADAKVRGEPVVVSPEPSAELDLDMIALEPGLLIAWSDRRAIDPRVYLAGLDAAGKLSAPPQPATEPFGEQALVRLVKPARTGGPPYLAWENLAEPTDGGRRIHIATIARDAKLGGPHAVLRFAAQDGSMPELVASPRGVAALTVAPACAKAARCDDSALAPTYVELNEKLDVIASQPVRLAAIKGSVPAQVWNLGCGEGRCLALAALSTTPAPVFAVALEPRVSETLPAAERLKLAEPPRAVAIEALAAPDALADIALAQVGSSMLVASVTYFDPTTPYLRLKKPAADGRYDPLRALLEVRSLREEGPTPAAQTISLRATSLGGVAFAHGDREALLAWAALDNGQPQVFLTMVGEDGRRLRQKMLTRSPGEVSDVDVTSVGGEFLVAWVDERHGDPEVYATKVDRLLRSLSPERRVTQATGAATDVQLAPDRAGALIIWADAREGSEPGQADIWVTRLDPRRGLTSMPEERLTRTRAHSHSPRVATILDHGALVAWIEEPDESAGTQGEVRMARIGPDGKLIGSTRSVRATKGRPTALDVSCPLVVHKGDDVHSTEQKKCYIVMSVDVDRRSELQGFELSLAEGSEPRPRRLATLSGPSGQTTSPALWTNELFYADQANGKGRLQRMKIEWR